MTSEARIPEPVVAGQFVSDIAKKLQERLERALREAYETGFLTLGASRPAERWRFFQERTLGADHEWLMDKDYLAKRRTGEAPTLLCEQLMLEYAAQAQQAEMMGLPLPPEPVFAYPWPVVLAPGTASYTFTLFQADYTALSRAEERRQQEMMAEMDQAGMVYGN